MHNNPLEQKVSDWAKTEDDIHEINLQINYMAKHLFNDYEPTIGPYPPFMERLSNWLDQVNNIADENTMFRLVSNIFYVGQQEFYSLYRAAYNGPIATWLINQLGINLDNPSAATELQEAVRKTWFCPITDSMRINSFYRINHINNGLDYRLEWRSFVELGEEQRVRDDIESYIQNNDIDQIVLLEDFVGSGNQAATTVEFASTLPSQTPVLYLPLIVCQEGQCSGNDLSRRHNNTSFSHVILLNDNMCVKRTPSLAEPDLFDKVRDLAIQSYPTVCGGTHLPPNVAPYSPFGYRETGALVVLFSNCPDNTLPLIQHPSSWQPLFRREPRI